jgi:hypothetical protein
MHTTRRLGRALIAVSLFLTAGTSLAGDAKKVRKGPHLDYRRSYAEALTEARIRNVPVFFSRQKDF